MTSLAPMTPPILDRIVKKCLAKDPDDRWQSARDICEQLRWISDSGVKSAASASRVARSDTTRKWMWAVGGFAVLALVLIAGVDYFRRTPVELRAIRFTVSPPEKQDFPVLDNNPSFLSVSPDGTKLAFVTITEGHYKLWLRDLDSQTAQALPGTEEAW